MSSLPRRLLLDLDGTLYLGGQVFPGTRRLLEVAVRHGIGLTYLTNNCSRSTDEYRRRVAELGLEVGDWEVVTSGDATIAWLLAAGFAGQPILLLGTPSLAEQFAAAGLPPAGEDDEPAAVVVGFDTGLTFARLCRAAWWLKRGKPFIATHPDVYCPTLEPTVLVDCGAVCAALTAATGVAPTVLGKPHRAVGEVVLGRHGLSAGEVLVAGDRLGTDIGLAESLGCRSALVLTGATSRAEAEAHRPAPTLIVEEIGELAEWLERGCPTR